MSELSKRICCSEEVSDALAGGRPVLALESTIITHGMPWPRNLETTRQVEQAVRDAGAIPATIAVTDGRGRIGLSAAELERLARVGPAAAKCSRRDLAATMVGGASAGTTVAATMILAHLAGIRVFATGGIGGVHRGAAGTFDISADLQELARTPVAVVCAGPKAILDIGLTLEYLETLGVPVVGYRTDDLPAFYSRTSGFGVDCRLDTPEALAGLMETQLALGLTSGMVIANPIPDAAALDASKVEVLIEQATRAAMSAGITGKALTPFLLQQVEELTGGQSLEANIALVTNNARLGAEVAAALAARQADT
jgi:pseudouridine-5'-phosphate glycosidase